MWIAHLLLFRGTGLAEWIGLVVVVQNIVGSLFNSHLFDFAQGWVYVLGVGVAGGMALKNRAAERQAGARAMNADRIALPAQPRILVVALRRLGDVLLTTPLIRSLRRAWPDATIDALVFADTAGILDGNPDLNGVIAMPPRPTDGAEPGARQRGCCARYDLAISTQSGDRPTFFAIVAGRMRVGAGRRRTSTAASSRRCSIAASPSRAACIGSRKCCGSPMLLGIARVPELVCPRAAGAGRARRPAPMR